MVKKKKRVDAPNNGQPDKKRKLNEISESKEDEEMINASKETNPIEQEEENNGEVDFACENCSG
jgi:hypothetical protein